VVSAHDEVAPLLGERRTQIFCHAISAQNDCLICSTFFRRLLADALRARLDAHFTPEQIVLLTAFGAIMVATNVVNDALGVPLDGYLEPYRARVA
jgi:hypothetical protein